MYLLRASWVEFCINEPRAENLLSLWIPTLNEELYLKSKTKQSCKYLTNNVYINAKL